MKSTVNFLILKTLAFVISATTMPGCEKEPEFFTNQETHPEIQGDHNLLLLNEYCDSVITPIRTLNGSTTISGLPVGNATIISSLDSVEIIVEMGPYMWLDSMQVRYAPTGPQLCATYATTFTYAPNGTKTGYFFAQRAWGSLGFFCVTLFCHKLNLVGRKVWQGQLQIFNETAISGCCSKRFRLDLSNCMPATTSNSNVGTN